jgi:hypothetical protein
VHDSKTGIAIGLRACICRIIPFRRRDVSKVCHGSGVLLAICRITKMSQRLIAEVAERHESGVGARRRYTSIEIAHPQFQTAKPKVGS